MLAIQPSSSSKKTVPNLLPCSIKHSGPIRTSKRHWNPTSNEAYFRGRKLVGKAVDLPEGYEGVVLQKTEKLLPQKARLPRPGDEDEEAEQVEPMEVKIMERQDAFEQVVVWGHGMVPDDEDAYIKGVKEWIGFAKAIHSYDSPAEKQT